MRLELIQGRTSSRGQGGANESDEISEIGGTTTDSRGVLPKGTVRSIFSLRGRGLASQIVTY